MSQPLGVISKEQYWFIRRQAKGAKARLDSAKAQKQAVLAEVAAWNKRIEAATKELEFVDSYMKAAMLEYESQHPSDAQIPDRDLPDEADVI